MNESLPLEISPKELVEKIQTGDEPFLLDVREAFEREIANIGGVHIPLGELQGRTDELPKEKEIVVYCRSGVRSAQAAAFLQSEGFEQVFNLGGGTLRYSDEVDSSLPKY